MRKYRHIQPKYKTAKRLLNLLKYRRHKKIRESILNSRKKLASLRAGYNRIKHKYFSKKEKLGFYDAGTQTGPRAPVSYGTLPLRGHLSPGANEIDQERGALGVTKLAKKKYKIHPYLSNAIRKSPRKYVYHYPGKDILRKYYTMPFRLNISRFISSKVLRSYYRTLSHKALLNLCQKASRGRGVGLDLRGSSISGAQTYQSSDIVERAERAKNFLLCLEERLDSTSLRLLHLKPLTSFSSVKRSLSLAGRKQKTDASAVKLTKYPKYQIKSPWAMFGAERIRQPISHGHILINGKKVQSPGAQIRPGDQIQIKGYIVSIAGATSGNNRSSNLLSASQADVEDIIGASLETLKRNHKDTLLLRRSKDQTYLNRLSSADNLISLNTNGGSSVAAPASDSADGTAGTDVERNGASEEMLHNYIRGLRIKRFTEAFYMTYRNLHLIERTSSLVSMSSSSAVPPAKLTYDANEINPFDQATNPSSDDPAPWGADVEKHIQPVFETIGYNQSIYLSWPVIPLLRSSSWGPSIKRNLIQSSTRALGNFGGGFLRNPPPTRQGQEVLAQQQKKKLQNLLKRKKLQASAFGSGAPDSQGPRSSIPHFVRSLPYRNPSWLHTRSRASKVGPQFAASGASSSAGGPPSKNKEAPPSFRSPRSYAPIVHGTRKCKWIRLQQGSGGAKGSFYNQIPNHTQFFQSESEFFQSVYRGVQGQS